MEEMDEIIKEFLVESFENLDKLDQDLVAFESNPQDTSILNRIFRIIHTIKGTSGFFGLGKLESIAHLGENLLDGMRSGKLQSGTEITSALLGTVDAVREILTNVQSNGSEGDTDYSEILATLRRLTGVESSTKSQVTESAEPILTVASTTESLSKITVTEEVPPPVIPQAQTEQIQSSKTMKPTEPEAKVTQQQNVAETSLRVDVHLIDELMNLVSELVLARNQIIQFTRKHSDSQLLSTSQRLNVITTELQENVMRTRMQPIENVWNKFPRVVRDVAQACKKEVKIEMEGKETELDKTIIEAIKDPLTHIIRNSVDHGLELPEVRKGKGKDPVGTVTLRAFHEGGHVIIEIIDDGAGLNIDKIKSKAVEKGLITSEVAAKMTEREAAKLIFAAGFSTADQVTNISGRGVGMDVVRSNIERIGGVVDVLSTMNLGTTIRIKIPLTLAIIPALIVMCGGQRFAIPQVSLVELVRVDAERMNSEIKQIGSAKFYRLRGNLLPLISLKETLKMPEKSKDEKENSSMNIAVVQVDGGQFGVVVDSINDTEEIVVKPLSKQLKDIQVLAGAAIMGDGRIALIVDVTGLAKMSNVLSNSEGVKDNKSADSNETNVSVMKQSLLVVKSGEGSRVAIPLSKLSRLEEFNTSQIESASGQSVIQYRGAILPLLDLSRFLGGAPQAKQEVVKAVVLDSANGQLGLIVECIVDIVEEAVTPVEVSAKAGVTGSAVVGGLVTDFIDIDRLLSRSSQLISGPQSDPASVR